MKTAKSQKISPVKLVLQAKFRGDEAVPVIAEITLSEVLLKRIELFSSTLYKLKAWNMRDHGKHVPIKWRYEQVTGRDSSLTILVVMDNAIQFESGYTYGPQTASIPLSAIEALKKGTKIQWGVIRELDGMTFYAENRAKLRALVADYRLIAGGGAK